MGSVYRAGDNAKDGKEKDAGSADGDKEQLMFPKTNKLFGKLKDSLAGKSKGHFKGESHKLGGGDGDGPSSPTPPQPRREAQPSPTPSGEAKKPTFCGAGQKLGSASQAPPNRSNLLDKLEAKKGGPQGKGAGRPPASRAAGGGASAAALEQMRAEAMQKKEAARAAAAAKEAMDQQMPGLGALEKAGGPRSMNFAARILNNILASPDEPKYRKLRMTNPKLQEAVFDMDGGQDLLTYIGFQLNVANPEVQEGEEAAEDRYAILPMDASLERARAVYSELQERGFRIAPPSTPTEAPPPCSNEGQDSLAEQANRHFTLFKPPHDDAPVGVPELPDSFYELTPNEAKQFLSQTENRRDLESTLTTQAYKNRLTESKKRIYRSAIVRVRFADGHVLQGVFSPAERLSALVQFVAGALEDPSTEFELYAHPSRQQLVSSTNAGEAQATLSEAGLVPAALINFRSLVPGSGGSDGSIERRSLLSGVLTAGAVELRAGNVPLGTTMG